MKQKSPKKTKAQLVHQYYTYTGFYDFVWGSLKKALPPIIAVVIGLVILGQFVSYKDILVHITETWSDFSIFAIFFASESFFGLLPPEIFIAWTDQTVHPFANLALLATLSYLGGVVSYGIGRGVLYIPAVHEYVEVKMANHIENIRKWGGILIVVGALLPLPFSIASMAAGIIKYDFKTYLLVGLFRFPRYVIYAIPIFLAI